MKKFSSSGPSMRKSADIKANSRSRKKSRKSSLNGFKSKTGSKAEVWHQTARQTKGGVRRSGLMKTKNDRIVFKAKHIAAKESNNLGKAGIYTRPNEFGAIKDGINLAKVKKTYHATDPLKWK